MGRHAARPNEAGRKRKYQNRPVDGSCPVTGKLRFPTRAKARKELKRYVAEFKVRSVYPCPHPSCGGWHLTKQTARRRAQGGRTVNEDENQIQAMPRDPAPGPDAADIEERLAERAAGDEALAEALTEIKRLHAAVAPEQVGQPVQSDVDLVNDLHARIVAIAPPLDDPEGWQEGVEALARVLTALALGEAHREALAAVARTS